MPRTPSCLRLGPEDRQRLLEIAPPEPGDHLVSLSAQIFGVVRRDALGCRIIALGTSVEDAIGKVGRPQQIEPRQEPRGLTVSRRRGAAKGGRRGGQAASERRRAAEAEFRSELAEYRRAAAAVGGGDESKLLG